MSRSGVGLLRRGTQGSTEQGEHLGPSGVMPNGDGMNPVNDAELMNRVRSGDREAFEQLVNRHKDGLVNYLTCLTHCRDRAEELAQESFLRLYQHSARYREQGQFLAFLFRIATNLLRSEERRARRWRILSMKFSSNGHDPRPTPQARLLKEEATERVAQALAELPLKYRSPLVLREIEGWSYREIAATLGFGEGTVKSRIHRGRAQLRHVLSPYWNGGQG
jgi:RNA polymerase sigma-70 factor, ECF subfamily